MRRLLILNQFGKTVKDTETPKFTKNMALIMDLAIFFSFLNAVLLAVLLYLYARIAIRSKASYSVGLLLFAVLLLSQNLLVIFAYGSMGYLIGEAILPYLFAISLLQFGGLIALTRITL